MVFFFLEANYPFALPSIFNSSCAFLSLTAFSAAAGGLIGTRQKTNQCRAVNLNASSFHIKNTLNSDNISV